MSTPTPARSALTYRVPMSPPPAPGATTEVMPRIQAVTEVAAIEPIRPAHQAVAAPLPARNQPGHVVDSRPKRRPRRPRPGATRRAPMSPWLIAALAAVCGFAGGGVLLFFAVWLSRG